MIHKNSDIQSKKIGNDTKIWQYCIVLPDAIIGKKLPNLLSLFYREQCSYWE